MGKKHYNSDAIAYFRKNKIIPKEYEKPILDALSYYPELINIKIVFQKKADHPVPYGTTPSIASLLLPGSSRKYIVTLREEAPEPMQQVLFKNLPLEAQIGVIGHELGHIVQYESFTSYDLIVKDIFSTKPVALREMERNADIKAIEHGLGHELHLHAVYIRSVDGYVKERPEIDINYLKPHEILQGISQRKTGVGV